eukprot:TRINITY_DN25095_c0_g1_i1.p1 TRINITY_DN25095_c0_g1~~TRINITY_DN25095_c0_g1_i1.p1  ORF type:complete len:172 (-),score=56.14 TRINITY_DN25095_c0_g1_i1:93-608(-)
MCIRDRIQAYEAKLEIEAGTKKAYLQNIEELTRKQVLLQEQLERKTRELEKVKEELSDIQQEYTFNKHNQSSLEGEWQKRAKLEKDKYEERISELEEKIIRMNNDFERERNDIEDRSLRQLEEVENRVKKLIFKKESEIKSLREDLQVKESLCSKYEILLEKQRRDLVNNI